MANSRLDEEFDVVVVGGGAAGVAAAIGAAQSRARVCLIEKNGFLGGAATGSSVLTYCGFFDRTRTQVVRGVGQLFLDALAERELYLTQTMEHTGNTVVLLDLETTKLVLDELLARAGVTTFLHATVIGAAVDEGAITGVTFVHRGGTQTVRAAAFVDGSGDGALIAASGAPELRSDPADRQASTLVMRVGGVPADATLDRDELEAVLLDYTARTGVEFVRTNGSVVRMPVSGEVMMLLADARPDVLDARAVSAAETAGRRAAHHYVRALRQGAPGWRSAYLAETGPSLGVRESRRLHGLEILDGQSVADGIKRPDDGIARGGWPMEAHRRPGRTQYTGIKDDGWFDVPYGAVASAGIRNLWAAGRLLSVDEHAFASTRVMGTAFATGHAAGVAAAQHAHNGRVELPALRAALLEQGALL